MIIKKIMLTAATAGSMILASLGATGVQAATVSGPDGVHGPWAVHELSQDSARGRIETFKVDRDLVAWTELDAASGVRYLRAWDGSKTLLLAAINDSDWQGNDFYQKVEGNYDVADGVVVWTMNDGYDNEIYAYRNGQVERLTDNSFEDKHPITSAGRIVWTSDMGSVYKLMVNDAHGERSLDQYHVMNYVLSGSNLYWLNTVAGGSTMQVHSNDGVHTRVLGEAEVHPYDYDYLMTDGNGAVVWEILNENLGQFGMHVVYGSEGIGSRKLFERQRWYNEIRIEDVRGNTALISNHDTNTRKLDDHALVHASGIWEVTVTSSSSLIRAQFTNDAHVRHQSPYTASPLVIHYDDGTGGVVSLDRIRYEMFEANDDTVAAAYHEFGGLMLLMNRVVTRIPTDGRDVTSLATRGNTTVFVYGEPGAQSLAVATPAVLVGNSSSAEHVSGRLVTAGLGQAVYLATDNGKRYVFPSEGQFYSWYENFSSLQVLTIDELAAMPLSGSVLYPSRTLVKTPSSPMVYTVGADGQLHWVTDGLVLATLYGDNWNRQVRDLPASFITSYHMGGPVMSSIGYYNIAITK